MVGKPLESILSLWQTEAIRIGAIMLALIVFVLGATLFLAREISRRAQAEDKLEELATTDALTGLKNRRKFDAEIDAEWRRAARQKTPLALLMIDADHFKAYNDTYGHQAGDQVLVGIAICISDSVRRAGDCAARYGGEEFAVLLPGCAAAEALTVAETIRLKVQQWSEHHHRQHRRRQPDAASRHGMVRTDRQPPTRRFMRPRPAAATVAWSPTCRSWRWWLRGLPVIPGRCAASESSPGNLEGLRVWSCGPSRNDGKSARRAFTAHFSRYFFISARRPSRRSARAMPKAMLARRKPGLEPQSCRSPSNSTP